MKKIIIQIVGDNARIVWSRSAVANSVALRMSLKRVKWLPVRIFQFGIPLVLAFKIYEWAIVNDGLRQVASNPNIGVLEFFRTILENTNF